MFDYSELLSRVVDGFNPVKTSGREPNRCFSNASSTCSWTNTKTSIRCRRNSCTSLPCGAQITVVGDDDQTIYQWRGSAVNNILTFAQRYPNVTTVNDHQLPFNAGHRQHGRARRSTQHPSPAQGLRFGQPSQYEEGDIMSLNFSSPEDQAEFIAHADGFRGHPSRIHPTRHPVAWPTRTWPSSCSVRKDAAPLIHALREHDIPFIVRGVQQLFDNRKSRRHAASSSTSTAI